ncbi:VOC family protein [Microlunatus sp. GCM10028923]|uniref:VOC family protein n=1 Tax=Microlunatus sp. GCM10028923 TaxID=3273400 RepID=UPI00360EFC32
MAHLLRDTDAMTITIGSPELINGQEGRRVLAAFYGELLGLRAFEPYGWLKLTREPPDTPLQLALDGDGWSDARPPRWPDPEYPQQLHLDLFVPDLDSADQRVRELGAARLADQDHFRIFADPAGHPFCLYPHPSGEARIGRLVIDCLSPRSLADFYAGLLGVPERTIDTVERVELDLADDELPNLAFQHAQFPATRWPDPAYPAQLHVDYRFPDGAEAARARAVRLGAIPMDGPVYADPAGHPFCL